MPAKSSFLDKVLGRIGRLDAEGLQAVVQRLARERSFLEMLFNTIEDGVLVVDEEGAIIYFNQAVTRILGWDPESAEGEPVQRYLPQLDWEKMLAPAGSAGPAVVRHEFEVQYPALKFLRLYTAPLDAQAAGRSGLALILHDATEARQQTHQAIESERIHSLTLLAASVAHEIGNPLNALHIHLQLMSREIRKLHVAAEVPEVRRTMLGRRRQQPPSADVAKIAGRLDHYLEVAKGEITRLDYIVTQFLQAIRPSKPQIQPASINQVVQEVLELLRPELENRGLQVEEKLARKLPPMPIDPGQIKQALVNLIKNAMQAMTTGGRLTLATWSAAEGAWISIEDTGGGIPQEQINRIFEPFYTTKSKGSGLGLMIVQRIIRDHGGRIELESHVGRGTLFRIWLPFHDRQPRLLRPADPTTP